MQESSNLPSCFKVFELQFVSTPSIVNLLSNMNYLVFCMVIFPNCTSNPAANQKFKALRNNNETIPNFPERNCLLTWLVLLVHAVASSNYYIVASPCELLNIRAVICKRDRPAIIPNICFRNMRDVIKILKWRRQHMAVVDQVTKCHA